MRRAGAVRWWWKTYTAIVLHGERCDRRRLREQPWGIMHAGCWRVGVCVRQLPLLRTRVDECTGLRNHGPCSSDVTRLPPREKSPQIAGLDCSCRAGDTSCKAV